MMTWQNPATLAVSQTPGTFRSAAVTMAAGAGLGLYRNVRGDHVTPA